jgi:hypothetical protein
MNFDIGARDNASDEFLSIAAAAESLQKKLERLDGKKVEPKADLNITAFSRKVQQLETRLDTLRDVRTKIDVDGAAEGRREVAALVVELRKLSNATVKVRLDGGDTKQQVTTIRDRLRSISDVAVRIDITGTAEATTNRLATKLGTLKQVSPVKLDVRVDDTGSAATKLAALKAAASDLDGTRKVKVDVDGAAQGKQDVTGLVAELKKLKDQTVKVTLQSGTAKQDLTTIRDRIRELRDANIKIDLTGNGEGKANRLSTKLMALKQLSPIRIEVRVDENDRAMDRLAALRAAAAALGTARPNIQVTADTAAALAQIVALRAQVAGLAGTSTIRVDIDGASLLTQVARIQRDLTALAGGKLVITADTRQLMVSLADARIELQRLKSLDASPTVDADIAAAEANIRHLEEQLLRIAARQYTTEVKVDVDKAMAGLGLFLKATAAAGAGIVALGALPQIASLGATVVATAGSLWLLPAALTTAGAGFAALKIATSGFGDALKNMGDPKKFAESLKSLAPSARETAVAIKGLQPAFDSMKLDLQSRLFDGLGKSISSLGATYIPVFHERLARISDSANIAATGITSMMSQASRITDIKTIGTGAAVVFENLSAAVKPLGAAFLDLATVGSRVLADLTAGAGAAAERFALFIAKARDSGQLEQSIRGGIDALKQLGTIAGNVGSILGGIFRAAQSSGADFVTTLERATTEVRNFVNSAQGQTALTNFFKTIRETVDAATPGVRILGTALADIVNKIGDSGLGERIGTAFSKLAEVVGPIASTLGNLAVTVIGPLISALGNLAPVLGPIATGLLGVWAAAKLMQGINAITPLITAFVTQLMAIGTAASGGGLIAGIKLLASSLGVGGILGIALAGAGIALGIFAMQQGDASKKAQEHKASLDALAGTLDKYSGAVTQATINEKAGQLAKDGTLEKVRQLGVSTEDYVRASLGIPGALERVNTQLTAHTAKVIGVSDQYKLWGPKLQGIGLSLDDLSAAASGSAPAMDKVQAALGGITNQTDKATFSKVVSELMGMGQQSADLARQLGITSGEFQRIQEQTRLAGEASNDFASKLDFLKQGLAGLKGGAEPTKEFAAGLASLAVSAGESASRAGEAAKALNGVGAGAQAASDAMQRSRDAFVETATTALGSKEAAEALANQIGLIPSAAKTIFESNATGVQAEMITLGAQIAAVPGAKTITVSALSEPAQEKLRALGFTVTTLPTGQVKIEVQDEAGRAKLEAFLAFSSTQVGTLLLDANPALANGKVTSTVTLANGSTGTITLDGNKAPVDGKIQGAVTLADGSKGTITIDGNQTPVNGKIQATVKYADGSTGTITLNPKDLVTPAIDGIPKTGSTLWTITYKQVTVGAAPAGPVTGSVGVAPAGGGVMGFAGGGIASTRRAARGFVVPGYEPGRDTIPAILSRGEAVLVPELVRRLGARRILAANAEASGGRRPAITGNIASLMDGSLGRSRDRLPRIPAALRGRAGVTRDELAAARGPRGVGSIVMPSGGGGMSGAVAAALGSLGAELRAVAAAGVTRGDVRELVEATRSGRGFTFNDYSGNSADNLRIAQLHARVRPR